jgi:hypothetical protein
VEKLMDNSEKRVDHSFPTLSLLAHNSTGSVIKFINFYLGFLELWYGFLGRCYAPIINIFEPGKFQTFLAKADISTLLERGHFYFALTNLVILVAFF